MLWADKSYEDSRGDHQVNIKRKWQRSFKSCHESVMQSFSVLILVSPCHECLRHQNTWSDLNSAISGLMKSWNSWTLPTSSVTFLYKKTYVPKEVDCVQILVGYHVCLRTESLAAFVFAIRQRVPFIFVMCSQPFAPPSVEKCKSTSFNTIFNL